MFEQEADIAILGSGCGALWLSYEMARRGFSCILIENGPVSAYASQRNQSWLHTGALYATIASEEQDEAKREAFRVLARECLKSAATIRRFSRRYCPSALDWTSGCLFLYENEDKADRAESMLQSYGLAPRRFRESIELLEPILRGSPLKVGLATPDIPFEASRLLKTVLNLSISQGTQIVDCAQGLDTLRIQQDDLQVLVEGSKIRIRARALVAAVGALANKLPAPYKWTHPVSAQRCTVAVLHKRVCNRMLVIRSSSSKFLNLVPFRGGTTINLGSRDRMMVDCDDQHIDELSLDEIAQSLNTYCPGLMRSNSTRMHFYVCQKVAYAGREPRSTRHYFWS